MNNHLPPKRRLALAKAYRDTTDPVSKIARRFGVNRSTVNATARWAGVKRDALERERRERDRRIRRAYKAGRLSLEAIAKAEEVSATYASFLGRGVRRRRQEKRGGRKQPRKRIQVRPRGEKHPAAKLTDAQRRKIALLGRDKIEGRLNLTWCDIRRRVRALHVCDALCSKIAHQALAS